jgi:hypothetical protein
LPGRRPRRTARRPVTRHRRSRRLHRARRNAPAAPHGW